MPFYQYKCNGCNKIFEVYRSSPSNGEVRCVHCNGPAEKLFSPIGIIFKGPGFYKTDSRAQDNKSKESSEKSTEEKDLEPTSAS